MKVYISGAITGLPRDEARAVFARAADDLKRQGHDPVDPFDIPNGACACPAPVDGSHTWACCLRKDIRVLVDCDAIYMLPGWEGSHGARLELQTASALGLKVWWDPEPMDVTMATWSVLAEVAAERERQDAKWGEQNHPDDTGPRKAVAGRLCYEADAARDARLRTQYDAKRGKLGWRAILREEVYEAFAETDPKALREELLQVAAVAVAWAEAIDRRLRVGEDRG